MWIKKVTLVHFLFLWVAVSATWWPFQFSSSNTNTVESSSTALDTTVPQATFFERASNSFQIWALQNPRFNPLAATFIPLLALFQGFIFDRAELIRNQQIFGGRSFCHAGQVWFTDYETVRALIVQLPQARTLRLGDRVFGAQRLPMPSLNRILNDNNDQIVYTLGLSQQGAGGDGSYEAVRNTMVATALEPTKALQRHNDATTDMLYATLADAYREKGSSQDFLNNEFEIFLVQYIHYVILGLDPMDEDNVALFRRIYLDNFFLLSFIPFFSTFAGFGRNWQGDLAQVVDLYVNSPDLQNAFADPNNNFPISIEEVVGALLPIISIAALLGPLSLARHALGITSLNDSNSLLAPGIDVLEVWDSLDLTDEMDLVRYLREVGRLHAPVGASNLVAQEDFTASIHGREERFPAGTDINVAIYLANLDEAQWGPTALEFDHRRPGLLENSLMFFDAGGMSGGPRSCPGQDIATRLVVRLLVELGEVRRSTDFAPPGREREDRDNLPTSL